MVTVGVHSKHHRYPPTCIPEQRLVGECLWLSLLHNFPALLFFLRYSHHMQLRVCVCISVRDILCLYLYGAGGMNPNEIFYGPVDLLIVPQVLSLLTTNLLVTTCWAWFFSQSPRLLLLCFSSFLSPLPLSSRWPQSCLLQLSETYIHTLKLCPKGVVAIWSLSVSL